MIIKRDADDDFKAFLTAFAMERAGIEVFSVSTDPNGNYHIWGRIPKEMKKNELFRELPFLNHMDELIEKSLDRGSTI